MKFFRRFDLRANHRALGFLMVTLSWLGTLVTAEAHDPGLSTAVLLIGPARIQASLSFSIVDARQLADPGGLRSGLMSDAEMADMRARMERMARGALELEVDGRQVPAAWIHCGFDEKRNVNLELDFPVQRVSKISVRSKWPGLLPAGHREFLSVRTTDGRLLTERLLSAKTDTVAFETAAFGSTQSARTGEPSFEGFLLMGVMHIWTGYDHLLFLFGLLIVTRSFPAALKIITCFTVAHSITLGIATLRLVPFSSRIVEPLIAASIVYVGIENLARGDEPKGRWLLTFAFGLIHGFGFASALRELGVGANGGAIIVPLFSFNLGVEAGQMAVAGLFLPIVWKLQKNPSFVLRWVPVCSTAVVLLGAFWFVQRVWF